MEKRTKFNLAAITAAILGPLFLIGMIVMSPPQQVPLGVLSGVYLDSPALGTVVSNPIMITGRVPSSWVFEGQMPPVVLKNDNGDTLGTAEIRLLDGWLEKEMLRFEATLSFEESEETYGYLTFQRDNPSGYPANESRIAFGVLLRKYP